MVYSEHYNIVFLNIGYELFNLLFIEVIWPAILDITVFNL